MNQNELKVKLSVIHQSIRKALRSDDVDLIPIVSVVSRKRRKQKQKLEDFSVDYLLPVQVGSNWIGIVYRDYQCSAVLMDRYDITNKAILCNPAFDVQSVEWFRNDYDRLKVIPDEEWKESVSAIGLIGDPIPRSMSIIQPNP